MNTTKSSLQTLKTAIQPYRAKLVAHSLYKALNNIRAIQHFTEWHCFAVWDFMSLLKSLQNQLTCTQLPWTPVGIGDTRYLINEIVLGEESDVYPEKGYTSHFELYLAAMEQMGANIGLIAEFISLIKSGLPVEAALKKINAPLPIQRFVLHTFNVIYNTPAYIQAAVFTFGREDLIPDMFLGMVTTLNSTEINNLSLFQYYLERHIEVDGGLHGSLALQMVEQLCDNQADRWAAATEAAVQALEERKLLWDGILATLPR